MPCVSMQEISDLRHQIVEARAAVNKGVLALGEASARLEKLQSRITAISISVHIDDQQKL